MGRILKLLTSSLDSCQGKQQPFSAFSRLLTAASDADITSIGDFNNLTSTATSMLKISVFAAWAELQCATSTHAYLSSIVAPYKSALCPAWLASLKEYSRLRSDADTSHIGTTRTSGIQMFDSSFSGLSREAALPVRVQNTRVCSWLNSAFQYFEQAWLPMLGAVGNLLRAEDSAMLLPLLREEDNKDKDSVYFFVLYGLAFDLLAAPSNTRRPSSEKAAATTSSMALEVLNCLLKRDIAKDSLIKSELFDELISLSLRLASTEPPLVQLRLVRLVGNLGREYNQELLAQATKSFLRFSR